MSDRRKFLTDRSSGIWAGWAAGWRKPDRRPIYRWAETHIVLPSSYAIPGEFSTTHSRYLRDVFDAIQDDSIREVTYQAAVQTGKTLIVEISIPWVIVNDPGPIMWTMQTDNDAREQAKARLHPLLNNCRPVMDLMPKAHNDRSTCEIYFGNCYILINGANRSNLQSKSIRWKFNSELWLDDWQGLMTQARGRVSKFEEVGTSKVVNESQAGAENSEIDQAFRAGDQNLWSVDCGTGTFSTLLFSHVAEDGRRSGVVWDESAKKPDGSWDIQRAVETCRYRCPATGAEVPDTEETRAAWNRTGKYIPQRPDAPSDNKSFSSNALVARPMKKLVAQWLNAVELSRRGIMDGIKDFVMQREARTYVEKVREVIVLAKKHGYTYADYHEGELWENECVRAITIDRQKDHFWLEARAWKDTGESRQIYYSRLQTIEQCREVQLRLGVEDRFVLQDSQYDQEGVYDDCVRFGWTAIAGSKTESWTHYDDNRNPTKRNYSERQDIQHKGARLVKFYFCANSMKNILVGMMESASGLWQLPDDCSEDYQKQVKGETKKEVRPGVWRWEKIHSSSPNHAFDASSMQTAFACAMGVIRQDKEENEKQERK